MLIKSWHQPKRESLVSKSPGAYSSYSHSSSLYSNTFHINSLSYPFNYYYYYYSVLRHPSCLYSKASNQKDSSGVKPTSLPTPPSDNTLQRVFSLLFLDLLLLLPTLHLDPCPSRTRLTLDCIAPPHVCCVSNARLYHCTSLAKVPSPPPPSFPPSFLLLQANHQPCPLFLFFVYLYNPPHQQRHTLISSTSTSPFPLCSPRPTSRLYWVCNYPAFISLPHS